MMQSEFSAGSSQTIVVYLPDDTSNEIDPDAVFHEIARDAEQRAQSGWRIVSTAVLPLRHTGAFLAREGSGFETKISVAVVYATA